MTMSNGTLHTLDQNKKELTEEETKMVLVNDVGNSQYSIIVF